MADAREDGIDLIPQPSFEIISAHKSIIFEMTDERFNG